MSFSKKQREYFDNASHRWNIKCGATRSGKTYMDYFVIPMRLRHMSGMDGLNVILGNTKGTLQRNIIEPLQNLWGTEYVSDIRSDNTAEMFGEHVHCLGADKINQVNRLRGSSIKYCYGDEVVTWHEDVFTMLKSRLDREYSKFDGTCNPENPQHWFKKFLDSGADIYQQQYTIDDNPFLAASVKTNLKTEYKDTVFYDRYILGKWVMAEGVIYKQFADNPEKYIVDAPPDDLIFATIGVDFGGNQSAHAFVCTGFTRDFKQVVTLDEFYLKDKISPAELDANFIAFVQKNQAKYTIFEAYCDSAETTLIQGLISAIEKNRIPISVVNAKKGEILNRVRFYNRIMSFDRYKIMRHCKNTIAALSDAVWDSKSLVDKRLDDGKMNIDCLDAMEYSTEKYMWDITEMEVIN